MNPLVLVLVFVAGGLVCVQVAANARLAAGVGSSFAAALTSSAVGALALTPIAVLSLRSEPTAEPLTSLPWWVWIGGFCGASYLAVLAFSLPCLGAAASLALAIAGQVLTVAIIDQFGLFGLCRQTPNPLRLAGIGLVLSGAAALVLAQNER